MKLAGLDVIIERTTSTAYGILAPIPAAVLGGDAVLFHRTNQPVRTLGAVLADGMLVALQRGWEPALATETLSNDARDTASAPRDYD